MQRPCKIEIQSTRKIHPPVLQGQSPSPAEEEWEEILYEEGMEPEDMFPDGGNPLPGIPPASTLLCASGLFSLEEDGTYRISYEDTEITGLEGCLTTFCLSCSGMLIMLRRGSVNTCMVFEENGRHLCDYGAEGGVPPVVLHTHELDFDLSLDGGKIFVRYAVEIRGTRTEENQLDILVTLQ